MKNIALLHHWLTLMRGGENVLAEFCKLYPKADIFTHAYNSNAVDEIFYSHKIHESFIAHLPGARKGCQKYLPLMPLALKKFDLESYDVIISSESGPIKGIKKPTHSTHICYCHTPMRYVWDMYDDYFRQANLIEKIAMRTFRNYLRNYDLKSADSVDFFIANSHFVAQRIQRIYGRESCVIHPPVDVTFFQQRIPVKKEDYYLFVGQLIDYKRADIAIDVCKKMNRNLIVVGEGSAKAKLQTSCLGSTNIQFVGRPDRYQLREYYAKARALLFPGVEDFGIVPLEAQATGTPVIALSIGGALETIKNNQTGIFFDNTNIETVCHAIEIFEAAKWDSQFIQLHTNSFSQERFRNEIKIFIENHIKKY